MSQKYCTPECQKRTRYIRDREGNVAAATARYWGPDHDQIVAKRRERAAKPEVRKRLNAAQLEHYHRRGGKERAKARRERLKIIEKWKPNERFAAKLLIDDPKLTNQKIGIAFDDLGVPCPWPGRGWEKELKRGAGAKWIFTVREKLRKLGLNV